MSTEERQRRVIRLALDEDKMTILCRKCFIRTDVGAPSDLPVDSTYVPKAEDAKEMALLEAEPVLWQRQASFTSRWARLLLQIRPASISSQSTFPLFGISRSRESEPPSQQRTESIFEHLLRHRTAIRLCLPVRFRRYQSQEAASTERRVGTWNTFKDSRTSALMTALIQQNGIRRSQRYQGESFSNPVHACSSW